MRKMLFSTISLLVACSAVYAAGSTEKPATTPATTTPAAATPATPATTATPAAPPATTAPATPATPATPPATTAPAAPATPAAPPATTAPAAPATTAPVAAPTTPATAAPATAAPAATTASLSGTWSSNLVGDVTLEQTGNKIVGTYHYTDEDEVTQDGKLEGVIEGKTIKAKWWQRPKVGKGDESRGDLQWKIADDGKTLTGWYREEGEKDKTDWNLTR